jgi:hypothetical protein
VTGATEAWVIVWVEGRRGGEAGGGELTRDERAIRDAGGLGRGEVCLPNGVDRSR